MRKTVIGCVTGAAAVLALMGCSSSAAPAAAPSTMHAVSEGGNYTTNLDSARVEANLGLSDLKEFLALTGT
jgi:hypothetical protein